MIFSTFSNILTVMTAFFRGDLSKQWQAQWISLLFRRVQKMEQKNISKQVHQKMQLNDIGLIHRNMLEHLSNFIKV